MKKIFHGGISLVFFFSFVSSVFAGFSDISFTDQYGPAIEYVKTNGIVHGFDDGTYKPDRPISRAEFTKILIGAVYNDETLTTCNTTKDFPDVDTEGWELQYVCVAYNAGIIQGYPDGTFRPSKNITFPEAAKIIINTSDSIKVTDPWWNGYIAGLKNKNAIPETLQDSVTSGDVWKELTRGEMADIMYRLGRQIEVIGDDQFSLSYPPAYTLTQDLMYKGAVTASIMDDRGEYTIDMKVYTQDYLGFFYSNCASESPCSEVWMPTTGDFSNMKDRLKNNQKDFSYWKFLNINNRPFFIGNNALMEGADRTYITFIDSNMLVLKVFIENEKENAEVDRLVKEIEFIVP